MFGQMETNLTTAEAKILRKTRLKPMLKLAFEAQARVPRRGTHGVGDTQDRHDLLTHARAPLSGP